MIFGRVPQQPLRCLALALRTTEADVAARFAVQFSQGNFSACQSSSSLPTAVPAHDASQLPANQDARSALNDDFSLAELRAALHKLRRKSATGPDGIPNQALMNLPSESLPWLVNWFNDI